MSDNVKEQEREELHRAIWSIADELRGSVDGWDFKSYVLGIMFYRYISENLTAYINRGEQEAGSPDFDYALLSDEEAEQARQGLIEEKGFFIKPSELFCNVRKKAPNDENLNETLEKVFRHIEESAQGAESEENFAGLFVSLFSNREDVQYVCRLVQNSEIADEDYNLSVSTYVEQEDTREKIDITVLNQQIAEIVAKENILRAEIDKIIAEIEG